MRYKPERALTRPSSWSSGAHHSRVEMRYKPERALTHSSKRSQSQNTSNVEMRYKPERALTRERLLYNSTPVGLSRNEA